MWNVVCADATIGLLPIIELAQLFEAEDSGVRERVNGRNGRESEE